MLEDRRRGCRSLTRRTESKESLALLRKRAIESKSEKTFSRRLERPLLSFQNQKEKKSPCLSPSAPTLATPSTPGSRSTTRPPMPSPELFLRFWTPDSTLWLPLWPSSRRSGGAGSGASGASLPSPVPLPTLATATELPLPPGLPPTSCSLPPRGLPRSSGSSARGSTATPTRESTEEMRTLLLLLLLPLRLLRSSRSTPRRRWRRSSPGPGTSPCRRSFCSPLLLPLLLLPRRRRRVRGGRSWARTGPGPSARGCAGWELRRCGSGCRFGGEREEEEEQEGEQEGEQEQEEQEQGAREAKGATTEKRTRGTRGTSCATCASTARG